MIIHENVKDAKIGIQLSVQNDTQVAAAAIFSAEFRDPFLLTVNAFVL